MTPLVLLVGFLGAGKTSLLRKLVPEFVQLDCPLAVILNDYQNARVDAGLFQEIAQQVVPISGSCVCCGSRGELVDALCEVAHKPGGLVLVETNGTTDATELVAYLAAEPRLRHLTLPCQISVVDAKRWQRRFWHNALERDQLRTATHLYLGHADQVAPARIEEVVTGVAKINDVLTPANASGLAEEFAALARQTADTGYRTLCESTRCCDHHHTGRESGDHAAHHFAAEEIALPAQVQRARFEQMLRDLPPEVLRVKGLVRLEEDPANLQIFQKVDSFDAVQIAPWPGDQEQHSPIAVVIGPHLPCDLSEKMLASLADSTYPFG